MVPLQTLPRLATVRGVVHGFTGRRGGVSQGAVATLNLKPEADASVDAVIENYRRIAVTLHATWGADHMAVLTQVHGNQVVRVERPRGPLVSVGEADAAFTTAPNVVLVVRTADCVPVLLAAPGVVAVAHAGWRGVASQVVQALLTAVQNVGQDPSTFVAAVGPAIASAAYEVGPEVVEAIAETGVPSEVFVQQREGERPHVDLASAVRFQLQAGGVAAVDVVERCTATDPDLYSHRAQGPATGRQAGVIGLVEGGLP